jgi:hypothetical protein
MIPMPMTQRPRLRQLIRPQVVSDLEGQPGDTSLKLVLTTFLVGVESGHYPTPFLANFRDNHGQLRVLSDLQTEGEFRESCLEVRLHTTQDLSQSHVASHESILPRALGIGTALSRAHSSSQARRRPKPDPLGARRPQRGR